MTELFVLTILGTIVAIYSVLPAYRQLRIGYSLGNKRVTALLGLLGSIVLAGYIGGLVLQHTEQDTLGPITIQGITIQADLLAVELIQLGALVILLGIFLSVSSVEACGSGTNRT
jgi:formate hydrogenlyase subunit 3/multisubunit Na+/H+ antiporter MnhD subunit